MTTTQSVSPNDADSDDAALMALIASLSEPDEVIERKPVEVDSDMLASVMFHAETQDEVAAVAAATSVSIPAALPSPAEPLDLVGIDPVPATVKVPRARKPKKSAGATTESAAPTRLEPTMPTISGVPPEHSEPVLPAKSEPVAAQTAPERVSVPRKHYADTTERLKDKLGDKLVDYSVLTIADAGVSEDELREKMDATMAIITGINGKAQSWAVKFVEYLAGRKSSMSEVTARTLKVLARDGFVTTGATGNLYLELISRPYSAGAARAMGGNNLIMLEALKLVSKDGKGRFIANPESILLMKANSMLKLA